MTVIPVSDHLVKQIRVAEPQHNVTRVVLDLESAVETSTLAPGQSVPADHRAARSWR